MARISVDTTGYALNFTRSTSDYVLCNVGNVLSGLTNCSISCWAKMSGTGSLNNAIYSERASSGNDIFKLEVQASGVLRFRYRDDANTLNETTGSGSITNNAWRHVVVVKNGTSVQIYLDNTANGSPTTLTATNNFTNSNMNARVSGDIADSAANFGGAVDDVRLYNVALSTAEINTLFNKGRVSNGLARWYKFDENLGSIAYDSSGNGGNATIFGATFVTGVVPRGRLPAQNRISITPSPFNNYIRGSYTSSSDSYFSISHNSTLKPTGDYTVEAFLLPHLNDYYQVFLGIKNGGSHFIAVGIDNSNHWMFNFKSITSVVPSNDNKVHFAAVYDSASNKIYGFIDGVLRLNTTNNSVTTGGGTNTVFVMKQEDDAVNQTWKGGIDELRFSNTQRYTGTTVGNTYFIPSTTPFTDDANTLLLLHMDNLGTTTRDSSSNNFTVTKTGASLVLRQAYNGRYVAA